MMIGVDIFSGAGGMSHGALQAGVDVQLALELEKNSATTYLLNHTPKYGMINECIKKFNPSDHSLNLKNKQLVLFGGPPCQGFSSSNQKNRNSNNSNNWLYEEFVRVVKGYMPDWIVFENVKGILETEKGIFAENILSDFNKLGYTSSYAVLKAEDYGVPQRRARFFIVASLHGITFQFPKKNQKTTVTVEEAISDLPTLYNGASKCYLEYDKLATSEYSKSMRGKLQGTRNNLVTKNNDLILERYKYIQEGHNWESIPDELMGNYKDKSRCHSGIYRRLINSEPSVVIGNYRKNMLIHPVQNRGLSVREAARLQSFPDSFIFSGTLGFQQQQVGNAVPPLLSKSIFSKLLADSQ